MMFKRPAREPISKTFLHCTDSDYPQHDNIETIRDWHVAGNGWRDIGYHFLITSDGVVHRGRDLELIPAAQLGYNSGTIAIAVTGKRNFTEAQRKATRALCVEISEAYPEGMTFHGHKEVDPSRTCPNFDYKNWLDLDSVGKLGI